MSQTAVKPDSEGYSFFAIPWDSLGGVGDPLGGAQSVIIRALSSAENAEVLNVTVTNNVNQECLVLKAQNVQTNDEFINGTQEVPAPAPKKEETIQCPLCEATFTRVAQYRLHMNEHKNSKKYKCSQCKESYNVEINFKIHMAIHQKGATVCPICDRKFQRLASLKAHLSAHQVEETFACAECFAEFEKEDDYNNHLEIHRKVPVEIKSSDLPLICTFCTYTFDDPEKYKEHIGLHLKAKRLVINKKRRILNNMQFHHKCDLCPKSFEKLCLLERHRRIHTGEKPFLCEICKKGFSQNGTLRQHVATQHTRTKSIRCMFCSATFSQKGNLKVHLEKTHSAGASGEKVYKCSHCTCVFKKLSSLNGHVTRIHAADIKKDEMFTTITTVMDQLKDLDKHTKPVIQEITHDLGPSAAVKEPDGVKLVESFVKLADSGVEGTINRYTIKQRRYGDNRWFICSYCAKEFKKPSDLIRHIRIHTKERPFECVECGQTFTQKSTLRNHLITHTKHDYDCVLCARKFSSLRTLNIHLRKHDKTAQARKTHSYKCSVCSKTFSTIEKAKEHIMVHDVSDSVFVKNDVKNDGIVMKEPMMETENGLFSIAAAKPRIPYATLDQFRHRPFRCHICNAAFLKSVHLKRHMQTHSGTKDHPCKLCGKAFYTTYGLKEHMNYHMQVRKHECKYCKKRFYTNSVLKRHLALHNAVKPYICPYCKKRFRQAYACRKHIKLVHRRDINVSLLGLLDSGDVNIDGNKVLDLADDITEVPFTTISTSNEPIPIVTYNNISTSDRMAKGKLAPPIRKQKKQVVNVTEQIVIRPPTGIPVKERPLLPKPTPPNTEQIVVDNAKTDLRSLAPKPPDPIEMTIENVSDNSITYPTIFITHEELQMLSNANVVNSLLPQLKLQNTDPLLLSSINELQDSNILYPISTEPLTQEEADFQAAEAPPYDSFNSNIIFSNNDLNLNLNLPEKNSEIDKPETLEYNEAMDLELQQMAAQKTDPNNLIILNTDEQKNLEMNYFNLNFQQSDYIDINTLNLPANASIGKVMQPITTLPGADLICSSCKVVFKKILDMEKHICAPKKLKKEGVKKEAKKESEPSVKEEENEPEETSCPHCNMEFRYVATLRRHISVKHKETIDNSCTFCTKKFKKRSDLERHLRIHTGEKPFACEKCDKSFRLKSTLQSHYRTHSTIVSKNFQCHVCDTFFSCKSSLKTHGLLHSDTKPYVCEICSETFRVGHHLRNHMLVHKRESEMQANNKMNLLEQIFLDTQDDINNTAHLSDALVELDTQTEELNQATQNLLATDTENLALKDPLEFDQMLLPSNFLNMGMQLEINGQLINVKATIDETLLNECESEDLLAQQLVGEPLLAELPTPTPQPEPQTKKLQCVDCLKFYATKSVLTKHRKLIHGGLKCDKCKKVFATAEKLETHSRLHSGYRPYSCPLCANSFTQESSLNVHVKRIHNIMGVSSSLVHSL